MTFFLFVFKIYVIVLKQVINIILNNIIEMSKLFGLQN